MTEIQSVHHITVSPLVEVEKGRASNFGFCDRFVHDFTDKVLMDFRPRRLLSRQLETARLPDRICDAARKTGGGRAKD
ncbi:MAG: hypothetical protein IID46_15645 [Planctomycetes bacterium]|nr:hypothetical protein [Planctomycetota bacterium]